MNKEEIEELKDFTIDITDIDELALGLEVCSKKSNIVIQEFANLIIELEQQNKKYKEVIDKANKFIQENCYEHYDSYNDQQYYILESKKELLDILKEVE